MSLEIAQLAGYYYTGAFEAFKSEEGDKLPAVSQALLLLSVQHLECRLSSVYFDWILKLNKFAYRGVF